LQLFINFVFQLVAALAKLGDRCIKRIRKAAYSLYFDLGCNVMQIQREVCPTFSIRMVKRMNKEFRLDGSKRFIKKPAAEQRAVQQES
jgi:hypothetical protein